MQTLYKITAHYGYKSQGSSTYYVIASDSTTAEKIVVAFHKKQSYATVDYCNSETIAQTGVSGAPEILLM